MAADFCLAIAMKYFATGSFLALLFLPKIQPTGISVWWIMIASSLFVSYFDETHFLPPSYGCSKSILEVTAG